MLDRIPTTLIEALDILIEQENKIEELKKEVEEKNKNLIEAQKFISEAEVKLTKADMDKKVLETRLGIYEDQLKLLKIDKFASSQAEHFIKIIQSQQFLFDLDEMKMQLVGQVKEEEKQRNITRSNSDKYSTIVETIDENETTDEEADIDIDDTLNDDETTDESSKVRIYNKYSFNVLKTTITPTEAQTICDKCGHKMVIVGYKQKTKVIYIQPQLVKQILYYPILECTHCVDESSDDGKAVRKSCNIKEMIPGGIATPSLLAFLMISKFVEHTTFHTKAQSLLWQNMGISKQNMNNWQIAIGNKLKPLYELLMKELSKGEFINCDETPINIHRCKQSEIQKEYWDVAPPPDDDTPHKKQCRIWVALSKVCDHWIKTFSFRYTRSGTFVLPLLNDSNIKVVASDAFSGYTRAVNEHNSDDPDHPIENFFCLIHSRRRFANSFKLNHNKIALEVLKRMKDIFYLDKIFRELYNDGKITEESFLKLREDYEGTLLDDLKAWLEPYAQENVIRTNAILKDAIDYFMKNYKELRTYLKYSFLTPSNNCSEQMCKIVCLIRRNSLFSVSPDGAISSCILLTLIQTAIANKINPSDYLRCLFEQAPYAETTEDWEKLLPWNIEITPFKLEGTWIQHEDIFADVKSEDKVS